MVRHLPTNCGGMAPQGCFRWRVADQIGSSQNDDLKRRALPYTEGDWIAVQLPGGGWAAGIIARSPRKGKVLFGYFFPKRFEQPPAIDAVSMYTPLDAVLIRMFGDLGLVNGRWKIIGHSDGWNREKWPMSAFVHYDALSGGPYKREYTNDGENRFIAESPCDQETASALPEDGLSGALALENCLQMALDNQRRL